MSKTAVITGGSHNIGQGIAIVLAEQGYDVAITYRNRLEGAKETQAKIEALGRKCFIYHAVLDDADAPQQVLDQAYKDLGHIDLMVCNAANGGARGSVLTSTPEKVDAVYYLNFRNYILCAGAAARYMVKDHIAGNIIFITSSRGERAYVNDYLYGGFKAGIQRATESMALDLSTYNIRVNCVAPGAVWPEDPANPDSAKTPFTTESIPLHRVGTARDIAEAVAFVASEKGSYMTGITLRIDGGLILPGMQEGYEKIPWRREEWQKEMYDEAQNMISEHEKK